MLHVQISCAVNEYVVFFIHAVRLKASPCIEVHAVDKFSPWEVWLEKNLTEMQKGLRACNTWGLIFFFTILNDVFLFPFFLPM